VTVQGELAGQDKHAAVPGLALYTPAEHNVHGPLSGPEEPGGHCSEHSIDNALPGLEVVPGGHGKHAMSVLALYLPDSHIKQEPPAGPM